MNNDNESLSWSQRATQDRTSPEHFLFQLIAFGLMGVGAIVFGLVVDWVAAVFGVVCLLAVPLWFYRWRRALAKRASEAP